MMGDHCIFMCEIKASHVNIGANKWGQFRQVFCGYFPFLWGSRLGWGEKFGEWGNDSAENRDYGGWRFPVARRKWAWGSNVAQTQLKADSDFKAPDRVIPRDRGMQHL